ncbi:MAG: tyramine oxidase [Gammaproteobacteria bacterium]|nr:tyramine oxidase [Gammaproteobacteria bacterium]MDH5309366.1 tyramine oxidase [Gammaproteobacteria bacterium]
MIASRYAGMPGRLAVFLRRALLVLTASALQQTAWTAEHPLDALDADEIMRTAALLRAGGHVDDSTPILSLTLEPPSKAVVLDWTAGEPVGRVARAVVRKDRVNREFLVDLVAGAIVATEVVPGPGQPPISFPEVIDSISIGLENPDMQAALAKRGITDFEALFCAPLTGGNYGEEFERTRRIVKLNCFDLTNNPDNIFAAPIEGLLAIVDLEAREVLRVIDQGVLPVPQDTWSLAPGAQDSLRAMKPVLISAPEGTNIRVDGWQVAWQKWRFHLRWDMRAGLVLSLASYVDHGKPRRILYQGNVSEIFVPYQDTTEGWYYRTYMDEGDYGIGTTHSPLLAGVDCPADAVYLSPVMANTAGGADILDRRICLFERATGDGTWRHYDLFTEDLNGRPNVELIVRFVATIGNYDYLFDWVLDNKGQLTYRVGASGLDAVKGVRSRSLADDTAAEDTRFGPLIAPQRAGINHDHFFSIRLDLDVDGEANRFVRDKLVPERQAPESKRRSIWTTEREVATTDSSAKFRLSYDKPSLWRVENSQTKNRYGYSTSYAIRPSGNARPLVDEDDPPVARAQFVNYHLWVTPYEPDELWAAGRYSNQSLPGQGLPAWTAEDRNVADTDIVLWYTLGFHHVPSAEDWPVYNLGWNSVTLRPYNFFDENPAMDLPGARQP